MIYIVNGAPGCGKTTFEDLCLKYVRYHAVDIYSTIDFVKDVAKYCGWNGEKTPENRKFLSDLKRLLTEWGNVPYKDTVNFVNHSIELFAEHDYHENEYAIFIDCREPEEITKLKVALGAKTVLIRRESSEQIGASNSSDRDVLEYQYDVIINNNGTVEELETETIDFLITEGIPINEASLSYLKLEAKEKTPE